MLNISFAAFFLMYVEGKLGLKVPDFHLDYCDFLQEFMEGGEDDKDVAVVMLPRGHSKSTNLDIFNAWCIYRNPNEMILHQGTADRDAFKCSLGTQAILRSHPLTENDPAYQKREHEHRLKDGNKKAILTFNPVHCFSGIGKGAAYLHKDKDYSVTEINGLFHVNVFEEHNLVDFYSRGIWEDRFTPKEMQKRRVKCETLNEWDSQYQMHDKPLTNSRLNPDYLRRYDDEPILRTSNGETRLYIGENRIVSMSCHMDPSSGKKKRDVSSVALIFQDDAGRIYWHRSVPLTGAIINVDGRGELIAGGQAWQVSDLIKEFHVTGMTVETNGVGTHVPANLLQVFKKRGLRCGVTDIHESKNKNDRILAGIEGPLTSGYLYAHKSILLDENGNESDIVKKMRLFNAETQDNQDDEVDALSKAITNEPIRIGTRNQNTPISNRSSWRPNNGMIDLQSDSSYT